MRVKKSTTFRSYLFGDFDKDGTKNIDDPKPFDPSIRKWPSPKKNPKYYHRARWGNNEVLLSDELRHWKKDNNRRAGLLNKFLKENPGAEGRIKTIPSTLKKVRERHSHNIMDVAGARILTDNRQQAKEKFKSVKRRYKTDPKETDDYYSKPLGGSYYAYHTSVVSKHNNRLEVQVKSKKMSKLADKMHGAYKKGKSMKPFVKKARKLYKDGY